MKKIFSTILIFLMLCQNAFAVTGVPDSTHWVAAGWGGGGRFNMVVADKFTANKFYAISDVGTPLVSTDAGENWTWLGYSSANGFNSSQPTTFIQSATTATLMYVISGNSYGSSTGSILKSTDGGQSWTKVNSAKASRVTSGKVIAFDPTNNNTVFAAVDNGDVIRTTDGGTTWATLFTPFSGTKANWLRVDPTGANVWVGGTNVGVKIWNIAGSSLSTVTLAGSTTLADYSTDYDTYIDGGAVENLCVATGVRIACTANEGSSWTYTAVTTSTSSMFVGRFAVSYEAGPLNFVVHNRTTSSNQGGSVQRYSNDSGATWTNIARTRNTTVNPMANLIVGGENISGITKDPNNPNVFFMPTDSVIYRSDDGGINFAEKDKGAQNVVAQDITFSPNGIAFMAIMDFGVQRSTDNGVTWTQVVPTTNASIGHYWRVKCLGSYSDWQAGNGIVINTNTRYQSPFSYINAIARSTDNGLTFTYITTGLPTAALFGDVVPLEMGSRGGSRALAASADGSVVYVGLDGENCNVDGTGGLPSDCSSTSVNRVSGGTFKSTDYGATWNRANGLSNTLAYSSPRKIYNALAVDPDNANNVLFGSYGYNMYYSDDAGLNFGYVSASGTPYTMMSTVYDATFDSAGVPYAVGSNSGAVIYKGIVTEYGSATGDYGTWQLMHRFFSSSITTGTADGIIIDPNNNDRIFVSTYATSSTTNGSATANRVFVTVNAGDHTDSEWTDITGDLPSLFGCKALAINPTEGTQGFLYCASGGNGIFKIDLADSPTLRTGEMVLGGDF